MTGIVALALHLLLMLAAAPALAGLLGPGHPAQAWRDLRRLFRKPGLWPEAAGAFGAAPVVSLGASLAACLLVPSFTVEMATAPVADLVLIALLFGLSRAALVLAGFDAGSGLASLSAQRGPVPGIAAEPAIFVLVLVLAAANGSSLLPDLAGAAWRDSGLHPALGLAAMAAAIVAAAFDHAPEASFAGRDLAVLRFAAQLRRVTVLSLAAALLLPFGLAPAGAGPDAWLVGAACWTVKVAVLGAVAAGIGRLRAGPRADQALELALLGLLVALIAAALFFAGQGTT